MHECRNCGAHYPAKMERGDGLCPACRLGHEDDMSSRREIRNGNSKENAAHEGNLASFEEDWREPLYSCAQQRSRYIRNRDCDLLMRMLRLLGDYRDCPQLLNKVQKHFEREYERIRWVVFAPGGSSQSVEAALKDLQNLDGWFDTQTLRADGERRIKELREKEALESEAYHRREARRKKKRRIIASAIAAAAAMMVLYMGIIVLPARMREADAYMDEGRYEEAYAAYERAEQLWYIDEAIEGMNGARLGMAETYMREARYEDAIRIFKDVGAEETVIREACLLYSDQLADQGRGSDALAALEEAGGEALYPERFQNLMFLYADEAADDVIAQGEGKYDNAEYARNTGKKIDRLDPQLRYCHRLAEAGYDLRTVYPDGVTVIDAHVGVYQIEQAESAQAVPDMSRILIFERQEKMEASILDFDLQKSQKDKTNDNNYRVKLLPGEMFAQPYFTAAERFEDATAIVLVDGAYVPGGVFRQWERIEAFVYKGIKMPATTLPRDYTWYTAINSIAAYDRERPHAANVVYRQEQLPPCADETWYAENKDDKERMKKAESRFGAFDMENLYGRLGEALEHMAE